MKNNLRSAERKIRRYTGQQWCGFLTASEAIAILDDGAKEHICGLYRRKYLQDKKDKGIGTPQWFYFYPSREQMKRWTS